MSGYQIDDVEAQRFTDTLRKFAAKTGYVLNPDEKYLRLIVDGLLMNKKRYGYASCPCRVADGKIELDKDIICPCMYRDPDLKEHGRCLCGLYVNDDYLSGRKGQGGILDRRKYQKMSR